MTAPTARFLDVGEAAILVEFGSTVDPLTNDSVLALDEILSSLDLPGVLETAPTYRSLMIHYDPLILDRSTLIETIRTLGARPFSPRGPKTAWTIPCCYDFTFGEDLPSVADHLGVPEKQVVAAHSGATFRVYMYGFAPGFCYLGGLPKELGISRRAMPRSPHPPNAVLIGGGLSLIATFPMPTGWWVIGRTPERMFSLVRDPNFLVRVGDVVRFTPIDQSEFDSLGKRVSAGEIVATREVFR